MNATLKAKCEKKKKKKLHYGWRSLATTMDLKSDSSLSRFVHGFTDNHLIKQLSFSKIT